MNDITERILTLASKHWRDRRVWLGVILFAGLLILFFHSHQSKSPVPSDVRDAVSFQVYYPKQDKLPAGYVLDTNSFRMAQTGVVIYSVQTGKQRLVFSEEQSPGGNVIDKFTSSFIPLHNTFTTDNGKALIGSAGQGASLQTVVSMPITKGPWLVVTAPSSTKQADLQRILESLTK